MSPRSFVLALALAAAPGLALAQAPDAGQPAVPQDFGDPGERAAPGGPDAPRPDRSGATRPGMGPGMGQGMAPGMGPGMMMDHHEMMRRHHGGDRGHHGERGSGGASISVRSGDRALMIRCGDTPIPDCVAGAEPLIELLR